MWRYFFIVLLLAASRSEAKYSGGNGTTDAPYLIGTVQDLVNLSASPDDWNQCFQQTADLDLAGTAIGMIGTEDVPFGGVFDGGGRRIANFTCVDEDGASGVGFFGQIRSYTAEVRNVILIAPNVQAVASNYVGALVGRLRSGSVTDCRVVGASVTGYMAVGGLLGWNQGAASDCSVTGSISGTLSVGGFVGITFWDDGITDCYADAVVTGTKRVGGFAGNCCLAQIDWSVAAGKAEGEQDVGGFIGLGEGGIATNSYATGSVSGTTNIGGFVGRNDLSCNCSSGALPSEIIQCYAIGAVRGDSCVGGLIGFNNESIVQRSFWDIETSGRSASDGGTGLTTAELQQPQTLIDAHWDFSIRDTSAHFWIVRTVPGYPKLGWQIVPGDFDDDGDVDGSDFSVLAANWSTSSDSFWTGGLDVTGDTLVDFSDLATLSDYWLAEAMPPVR